MYIYILALNQVSTSCRLFSCNQFYLQSQYAYMCMYVCLLPRLIISGDQEAVLTTVINKCWSLYMAFSIDIKEQHSLNNKASHKHLPKVPQCISNSFYKRIQTSAVKQSSLIIMVSGNVCGDGLKNLLGTSFRVTSNYS